MGDDDPVSSQNVIAYRAATKKPKTSPTPLVIVGAHYDSVSGDAGVGGGLGADDNASGVAVMLEVAERIIHLIRLHKLPIEIQPGLNSDYPAGLTPDGFSDYTAFNQADIPIVAFESTNWEIGDKDGYVQTELYGSFWHNEDESDTLERIEELFPGRPMVRLNAYTTLVFEFLKHLNP